MRSRLLCNWSYRLLEKEEPTKRVIIPKSVFRKVSKRNVQILWSLLLSALLLKEKYNLEKGLLSLSILTQPIHAEESTQALY